VAARPDGSVHVIVLNVGQGDATLLEGDLGGRILVDGGPDANLLLSGLDRYIPTWDRRLDAIVLTHPHDDHVAGLVAVVERYQITQAFEPGWPADTPSYRVWKAALAARGIRLQRLVTGRTIALDSAVLRVLWPDDGAARPDFMDQTAADNRKANDASIVLLGEYEDRRFLLTGDIEEDVDPVLLSRGLPAVDVLKVAHHGSGTASSDELLTVLRPRVAAISVGADNKYGHPSPGTLARLSDNAQRVYRTDRDGSLDIALDRAGVTVTASGGSAPIAAPAAAARVPGLLYDRRDVRTQPSRERGPASIARTARVAHAPLARRRRNGGVACVARRRGRAAGRSPPRGIGRAAA
jgi:competence protein ComEC